MNTSEIVASILDRLRDEFESRSRVSKITREGSNDSKSNPLHRDHERRSAAAQGPQCRKRVGVCPSPPASQTGCIHGRGKPVDRLPAGILRKIPEPVREGQLGSKLEIPLTRGRLTHKVSRPFSPLPSTIFLSVPPQSGDFSKLEG